MLRDCVSEGVGEALRVPVALADWLCDWLRESVAVCDRLCVLVRDPELLRVPVPLGVAVTLGLRDADALSVAVPACVGLGLQIHLIAVRRKPRGAGAAAQDAPPFPDANAPVGTAVPFAGTSAPPPAPSSVAYHARGAPGAEKAIERFG